MRRNKEYLFKPLITTAKTKGAIKECLNALKAKKFWRFEILQVSDTYLIERYSRRDITFYVHYSSDPTQFDIKKAHAVGSYRKHEVGGADWFVFKVCVYRRSVFTGGKLWN